MRKKERGKGTKRSEGESKMETRKQICMCLNYPRFAFQNEQEFFNEKAKDD